MQTQFIITENHKNCWWVFCLFCFFHSLACLLEGSIIQYYNDVLCRRECLLLFPAVPLTCRHTHIHTHNPICVHLLVQQLCLNYSKGFQLAHQYCNNRCSFTCRAKISQRLKCSFSMLHSRLFCIHHQHEI